MSCLSRVGCLVVLAAAGAGAFWFFGNRLPPDVSDAVRAVTARLRTVDSARTAARAESDRHVGWVAIDEVTRDDSAVAEARQRVQALAGAKGPAYATLSAHDAAAVLGPALQRALPRTAANTELAVFGDKILLRASVELREFAGNGALAALLGGALGGIDQLRLGGTIEVAVPGVAWLRVTELRVKGIDVPSALIPALVRELRDRQRSAVANAPKADSLPPTVVTFTIPSAVADVRVRGARLVLYRAIP